MVNNHSFAKGLVYKEPYKILFVSAFIHKIHCILLAFNNLLRRYMLWGINGDKFIRGTGCFLGDRVYFSNDSKKDNICFGNNVVFKGCIKCEYGGKVEIGNDVYVGDDTIISSFSKVNIGNNVLIAYGVGIFDNISHPINDIRRHEHFLFIMNLLEGKMEKKEISHMPINIKDNVWIGFNSIILKGVTVGEGAVVAAGSVVTKDVEPWTVVGGNPAQFIKNIER